MNTVHRIAILLIVLVLGCGSTQEGTKRSDEGKQEQARPAEPGPGIPPNHCRLVGTIVSISEVLSTSSNDPCSKAPCIATVRVDEILGYGSAFGVPLGKGKEIRVQFQYTLGSTKDLFPRMSPALPGLNVGAKFQTDVQMAPAPLTSESRSFEFTVGTYSLR